MHNKSAQHGRVRRTKKSRLAARAQGVKSDRGISGIYVKIALVAILAGSYALTSLFFYGPGVLSGYDSYIYAQFAVTIAHGGYYGLSKAGPLATVYLFLTEVAVFYRLFGMNPYSGMLADYLLLALSTIGVYLIGRSLYGKIAGLLAALVYAFLPFNIIDAASLGVNIPLGAVTIFAVLFSVLGYKSRLSAYKSSAFFSLSGLFLMLAAVTMVEGLIIAIVLLPVLLYSIYASKGVARLASPASFLGGALVGLGIIALFGLLAGGGPLDVFTVNLAWYGNTSIAPHSAPGAALFIDYLQVMFPFAIRGEYGSGIFSQFYTSGIVFYLAAASGAYMLLRRRIKPLALPAAWIMLPLLYLSFGTMSISSYVGISFIPRLISIAFPGAALAIGAAVSCTWGHYTDKAKARSRKKKLGEGRRARITGIFKIAVVFALVAVILFQSVYVSSYVLYSEYNYLYSITSIGKAITALGSNVRTVYTQVPMDIVMPYAGYGKRYVALGTQFNCSSLQNYSALITFGQHNASAIEGCGFSEINVSMPKYLKRYAMFNGSNLLPGAGNQYTAVGDLGYIKTG